jgi:hypothetical protein
MIVFYTRDWNLDLKDARTARLVADLMMPSVVFGLTPMSSGKSNGKHRFARTDINVLAKQQARETTTFDFAKGEIIG